MKNRDRVTSRAVLEEAVGERIDPGDVGKLSEGQVKRGCEALEQFFAQWTAPALEDDELRVSVGEQYLRRRGRLLGDLALYAHTVVVRDPLERWLRERRGGEPMPPVEDLAEELQALDEIRELVDAGIVLPAPFLNRDRWIDSPDEPDEELAMAKEAGSMPEFATAVLGGLPVPEKYWPLLLLEEDPNDPERDLSLIGDLPDPGRDGALSVSLEEVVVEALHKVERLRHATNAEAIFTPLSRNDRAFVNVTLPGLLVPDPDGIAEKDAQVISTLSEIRVPVLDDLSPRNLVAARKEADGFEEWRTYLRKVLHTATGFAGDDLTTMKQMVNDELELVAAEVRREVSRSRALKSAARDSTAVAAINAILWGGGMAAFGAQPLGSLIGAGFGALSATLAAPLMRKSPAGYRGVLLQLVR